MFLLFDFVHRSKLARNHWITYKVLFEYDRLSKTAFRSHIIDVFKLEQENIAKLSTLSSIFVYPKANGKRYLHVNKCFVMKLSLH